MNVRSRLILGGLFSLVGLVLVATSALFVEKSILLEDRKIKTRHLVETVHGLIGHYQALNKDGTLT